MGIFQIALGQIATCPLREFTAYDTSKEIHWHVRLKEEYNARYIMHCISIGFQSILIGKQQFRISIRPFTGTIKKAKLFKILGALIGIFIGHKSGGLVKAYPKKN